MHSACLTAIVISIPSPEINSSPARVDYCECDKQIKRIDTEHTYTNRAASGRHIEDCSNEYSHTYANID